MDLWQWREHVAGKKTVDIGACPREEMKKAFRTENFCDDI